MDAQKVYLHHELGLFVHADVGRNGGDEAHQLGRLADPDSNVPFLKATWRLECPPQKLGRVVKAEHVVIVLDVVFIEQDVELFQLKLSM